MPEFNYETQEWITDCEEAYNLRIEHIQSEIRLLESDAEHYLTSMGYIETPEEALTLARNKLLKVVRTHPNSGCKCPADIKLWDAIVAKGIR